ncbi:MAG: FAD-dependent oxidoreductase [Deltaproteobacteria bacterium]|nr:FAD-dependent oxidoreductase [Deltaproteobacteria bacterium]
MAKTPLLRTLIEIAKTHARADALGKPVEAVEEDRARARELATRRGVTRRTILKGVAGAAAAAAIELPRSARAQGAPRIAIVGAGIAGLNAALTLADAGLASTVYESSGRIGGRMFSNSTYWNEGQVSEWGGELIDTGHKTMLALCRRFGLAVDDVLAGEPNGSELTLWFKGGYYRKSDADKDFQPLWKALQADVRAAGYPTTYDVSTPGGRLLANLSVYDWIESRVVGGHASRLGALLDVAYACEYGADTRDQSSLNLVYLLGYQVKPGNFSIWGKSDERYHVRGGNDQVPHAIASALGSSVVTGHRLESLRLRADGTYDLSFRTNLGSKVVTADYVVLALPFAALANVDLNAAGFDMLKHTAIQQLGRGKNGKVAVQLRDRFWRGTGSWPGVSNGETFSDLAYQSCWDVTRSQPGTSGILVNYTAGARTVAQRTAVPWGTIASRGVDADVRAFFTDIDRVLPVVSTRWNGKATSSVPHLDPNLGLAYCYWKVGQPIQFAGYEGVRQGNVFFAGEHTSVDFQGWMEGGAETGARAGNEILTAIGRR